MLPLLQAAERGHPKRWVLDEYLVEPPTPTLLSPSLSLQATRAGQTWCPHTTMSLTYNEKGGGRGPGDKLNFSDDFFESLGLIFKVTF